MIPLLLAAAAADPSTAALARFDLAKVAAPAPAEEERQLAARYLLPDIDEPDEDDDGIRVKLKWRRVRLTVPLNGLQPLF